MASTQEEYGDKDLFEEERSISLGHLTLVDVLLDVVAAEDHRAIERLLADVRRNSSFRGARNARVRLTDPLTEMRRSSSNDARVVIGRVRFTITGITSM